MHARTSAITGALLLLALGVTGCTAQPTAPAAAGGGKETAAPAAGSTAAEASGTALDSSCDELLDPASVASIDEKLAANPGFTPGGGTLAAGATSLKGLACEWIDPSDNSSLVISAAQPDATTFATLKTSAAATGAVSTAFGTDVSAYTSGTQLQLFTADGFWVTAESPQLGDAATAASLGQALLEALPAG